MQSSTVVLAMQEDELEIIISQIKVLNRILVLANCITTPSVIAYN